jgi:hypothetical protein
MGGGGRRFRPLPAAGEIEEDGAAAGELEEDERRQLRRE